MADIAVQPQPQPAMPQTSNWEVFKDKAGHAAEAGKRFFVALYKGAGELLAKIYHFIIDKILPKLKDAGHFVVAHVKRAFEFVSTHREKALFVAAGALIGILITIAANRYFWPASGQSPSQQQNGQAQARA
jgi:hypothetical protein